MILRTRESVDRSWISTEYRPAERYIIVSCLNQAKKDQVLEFTAYIKENCERIWRHARGRPRTRNLPQRQTKQEQLATVILQGEIAGEKRKNW